PGGQAGLVSHHALGGRDGRPRGGSDPHRPEQLLHVVAAPHEAAGRFALPRRRSPRLWVLRLWTQLVVIYGTCNWKTLAASASITLEPGLVGSALLCRESEPGGAQE